MGVERLRAEGELKTRAGFEQKLIGIVSHDPRNPLSAILMGASLLMRHEELDARATRSLRIDRQPMDLHRLTRGVVEEVEAAWPGHELQVKYEGDGQGDWDADRLAQVVQNLVTNALKYSPAGPVHVTVRGEAGEVSLCVANEGPPIPPDKLASLFEPLQRATAELDKAGRSVGLYIVKRILDAHEGRIGVVSTPEEWTRFTVRLPRQGRATR